jgi:hypothetical protein
LRTVRNNGEGGESGDASVRRGRGSDGEVNENGDWREIRMRPGDDHLAVDRCVVEEGFFVISADV